MALALFAEIHVRDFRAAKPWYVQFLGEPAFAAHDTEEVWSSPRTGRSPSRSSPRTPGTARSPSSWTTSTRWVDGIVARGIEPTKRETYDNGVRKVTFHDPDGNEIGFGGPPL